VSGQSSHAIALFLRLLIDFTYKYNVCASVELETLPVYLDQLLMS